VRGPDEVGNAALESPDKRAMDQQILPYALGEIGRFRLADRWGV
jgi:hypothetical protein